MANKKKPVTDEIASVETDIFRDYLGKIIVNPDKILKSEAGYKGIELYEDLLRDDKVGSTLQTRKLAVVGKEWEVLPASEKRQDVKVADFLKEVFLNFDYDASRKVLLSGIVLGFKPGEIMWDYSEGDVWIKKIIGRSSRRFVFDLQSNMRMLTLQNMVEGIELPDRKFVIFRNESDNGSPYGDGLGRMLYWPVWFKKNAIKFWMIFADKFGSPTAVGKYPSGTPKEQQDKLLAALEAIQQESAIKIPDNMIIELLEAARQGTINTYETLCNFMNNAIAQIMLGQTLTSAIGNTGSYAASKTHEDVRQDYIKADADGLCECQNNSLVKWIVDYNFPDVQKYPKIWVRTEPEEDLKPLAERDKILTVDIGLPVTKKYYYGTYGIPQPQEGEELIQVPARSLGMPAFSERRKYKIQNFAEQDWVQRYMEMLAPHLKNVRETALNNIETWLNSLSAPPSEDEFFSHIQAILGDSYSSIDKNAIADSVSSIYSFYRLTDQIAPGAELTFGGADTRAVDFLSRLDNFYISKYIQNPDAVDVVKQFLKDQYLEGGAGLFGRTSPDSVQAFRDLFSQKLMDLDDWQLNRITDTAVQRIRNWAHASQLYDAGIPQIEIYEPTQECDFCKAMNGKIINVDAAYSKMLSQMQMSPDQYVEDLKSNVPTLDNIESFVDQALLPPYHPHCHGTIIKRMA